MKWWKEIFKGIDMDNNFEDLTDVELKTLIEETKIKLEVLIEERFSRKFGFEPLV